jgi:transcriptional regulator with XRE-family HTH domain
MGGGLKALRDYIQDLLTQKNLSLLQVEKRSKGRITDSYVKDILNGKTKSISVDKLNALAEGLGVTGLELYKVTSGEQIESDPQDLDAILRLILDMTPKQRKALLVQLRKK